MQLTQEAKIVSDFYSIRAIFAFVGFVSALRAHTQPVRMGPLFSLRAVAAALFPLAPPLGGAGERSETERAPARKTPVKFRLGVDRVSRARYNQN